MYTVYIKVTYLTAFQCFIGKESDDGKVGVFQTKYTQLQYIKSKVRSLTGQRGIPERGFGDRPMLLVTE